MTSNVTDKLDRRAELIADLRAFADLLERRPDMPVNAHPHMKCQYSKIDGDEDERVAEIRHVADLLGVEAVETESGINAVLDLGCIEYRAYASTDYGLAAYAANWSYHGVVEPETAVAR